jgi:hypothetical protein
MSEGPKVRFQFTTMSLLGATAWAAVSIGSAAVLPHAMHDFFGEVLVAVVVGSAVMAVGAIIGKSRWLALVGFVVWLLIRPAMLPPYF